MFIFDACNLSVVEKRIALVISFAFQIPCEPFYDTGQLCSQPVHQTDYDTNTILIFAVDAKLFYPRSNLESMKRLIKK